MTPGLHQFSNGAQFVANALQQFVHRARLGRSRLCPGLELVPAHPSVEKIADRVELSNAHNRFLRAGTAGSRLDLHRAETEPALKDVPRDVNVLNPRVSQIRFPPPKQ